MRLDKLALDMALVRNWLDSRALDSRAIYSRALDSRAIYSRAEGTGLYETV